MKTHEMEALERRLDADIERFLSRNSIPRSEARPVPDKYTPAAKPKIGIYHS